MADACAAVGAKDSDEALGKIRAGQLAIGERDGLQKALGAQAQVGLQKEFRQELKAAVKDGRLSLGEVRAVVPTMLKDEEQKKVADALAKLDAPKDDATDEQKKSYRSQLLDAVCSGQVSDKRLKTIRAFIGTRQPSAIVPAPVVQPALTEENAAKVTKLSDEQVKAMATQTGIAPERVAQLAAVKGNTVEDYIKAVEKK